MPSEALGVGERVKRQKTARMSLAADSKSPDTLCWKQAPGEYVQLPATSWDAPPCQMWCARRPSSVKCCVWQPSPVKCCVRSGSPLSIVVCVTAPLCQMWCVRRLSSVKCCVWDGAPLSNVVCVTALLCQMWCVWRLSSAKCCVWHLPSVK